MTDEYIHGYKLASYCLLQLLQLLQLVLQREGTVGLMIIAMIKIRA